MTKKERKAIADKRYREANKEYIRIKGAEKRRRNKLATINNRLKDINIEEYRDINGYEGLYSIDQHGRVLNVKRMKHVKPFKSLRANKITWNYRVRLCKDGSHKKYPLSHLVYSSWVGSFDRSKLVIDHIDNNPTNDHYLNLQAITQSENVKRQYNNGVRNKKTII